MPPSDTVTHSNSSIFLCLPQFGNKKGYVVSHEQKSIACNERGNRAITSVLTSCTPAILNSFLFHIFHCVLPQQPLVILLDHHLYLQLVLYSLADRARGAASSTRRVDNRRANA